ncbi:MAG: MmgE/PrpD family protein [Rhodospirillaceae bacterium]|nr:MmgE/PrpD family protein [Rhodospirillaceae bacterium]
MQEHLIKVHPSSDRLAREDQFAWKLAAFATSRPPINDDVAEMISCRLVDNASVALVSLNRSSVANALRMALTHPRAGGASLFGLAPETTVHAEWAAWANGTAVRELDFHDTYLAADYAHPGDSIPPLVAVAQQCGRSGADLVRAIAVAYEVHVQLVRRICLHEYKKDHSAHLIADQTAGLGALLDLPTEIVYQAINQAVHIGFSSRQSRKGEISSWKAYVPGHSGKLAVEAIDRAMRGEGAPNPIYEGEDSVIAWMLGGPEAEYRVLLPEAGEAPKGILETYTKAHSAEYQAQALIDLALEMGEGLDTSQIKDITLHTSEHTHTVIGTGANDPQKSDPKASRETLDHSITYILAVALEDLRWHHVDSYTRERASRPSTVKLWHSIRTVEDPVWSERYHATDPAEQAFGGRLEITLEDGTVLSGEKAAANAHPNSGQGWAWSDYLQKFDALTGDLINAGERDRFVAGVERVGALSADEVKRINPVLPPDAGIAGAAPSTGIFDWPLS